jgi:hypothetical protein
VGLTSEFTIHLSIRRDFALLKIMGDRCKCPSLLPFMRGYNPRVRRRGMTTTNQEHLEEQCFLCNFVHQDTSSHFSFLVVTIISPVDCAANLF